jgi:NitT/TauT family transport system substrate-binding protein
MLAAACVLGLVSATTAVAQQKPKITVSSLTLPVFNPIVWNIMKARGLDAKHGFELDIKAYPSISAFYAGFSTGETEAVIGGPTILQKLYQEGVPLRIFGTGFTLADLVVFARDDKIKSLADLKGKQLAADMGASQFQVIKIYTNAKGIELGKDITVVNANFAVARAQLEADRVEAALVIEPLASIILKQNPRAGRRSPARTAGRSCLPCAPTRSSAFRAAPGCCWRRCRTWRACSTPTPLPPTRSPSTRSSCRPAFSRPRSTASGCR